jgi:pantoate--beta-alanine ligase
MQQLHSIAELRKLLDVESSIVFVPTMGNLHEGHLDLVRQARNHGTCVVVSIFVNPLQFGPSEDFDKYPRTLVEDCDKLQGLADIVFAPSVKEMYPQQQTIFIEPPPIANELCGEVRPGHFRGMATVVLKLLNIVQPQVVLFGKKDYQQLYIIRQMVAQMNLPIRIIGGETVRAGNGLALSSRNQYLTESEREEAPFLHQVLTTLGRDILKGERDLIKLELAAKNALAQRGWQVEYVSTRNRLTLTIPESNDSDLVVLAAARLGETRLIDNLEINIGK